MKLNLDCVRDIMLWAEGITTPTKPAIYVDVDAVERIQFMYLRESAIPQPDKEQKELLSKYPNDVLVYHLNYCINARLLCQVSGQDSHLLVIQDLTPEGHKFVANIRSPKVFSLVKKVLKMLGLDSLDAASYISQAVVIEIIKKGVENPNLIQNIF